MSRLQSSGFSLRFNLSAAEDGQNSTGRVLASSRVGRPPVRPWEGPVRMGKGASLTETEGDWLSIASGPKASRPLVKVPWKAGSKVNICPILQTRLLHQVVGQRLKYLRACFRSQKMHTSQCSRTGSFSSSKKRKRTTSCAGVTQSPSHRPAVLHIQGIL